MSDHPIIFSAPMVCALLDGHKTMTRRLAYRDDPKTKKVIWPASLWQRVKPGDRLWVRETITRFQTCGAPHPTCHFPADETAVSGNGFHSTDVSGRAIWLWKGDKLPSIHMPRWASRLTLIVTATKIERLDQISQDDAKAEGAMFHDWHGVGHSGWRHDQSHGYVHKNARTSFACLWDRLHGEGSFNACQEVVALTFTVHKCNIDSIPKAAAEKPGLSTPQQDQRGSPT